MDVFYSRKSITTKIGILIVSFIFAFSVLFFAFPVKAFATSSENDVSTEETTSNEVAGEGIEQDGNTDSTNTEEAEGSSNDTSVSDEGSTVSSADEAEAVSEEGVSQTDDTSNSDAIFEDGQDQADNASGVEINSKDEEALQNQEFIEEEQPEEIADESSVYNDNDTSSSTEEENADDEDITSIEEIASEDLIVNEEEQIQSDDSLNSGEDVVDESESALKKVEEQAVETPEININILFSIDKDGYISVGEETNFSIDIEEMDIAECYWDFGDGSDSLDKNPTHTYKKDGNYTQTVTIVDSEGNSYSKTTTVHVSDHNPATTEWYVSPDAVSNSEDFEDGNSSENPVSIDSVLSHIVDGDTLYFLPGTYTGTYTEDKDSNISLDNIGTGTEDNSISFVGYDQAIFDGGGILNHAFSLTSPLSYLGFYNFTFINYTDSAIYIDNPDVSNINIVDNTFADNSTAIDVTMDSNLNIENNIIVNNNTGIDISSDNATIEHNIVVDNNQGIKVDDTKDNVAVDYNDVYNNQEDYIGTEPGENDISVDPMFVDREALDFLLQEDSPLLNSNIIRIVQTDEEDYRYNEQIIIAGSGHTPNQELILKILRPDGTFVEDIAVTTDGSGNFVYDEYAVDYAGKNYLVKITDTDGKILEVLSFTDNGAILYVDDDYGETRTGVLGSGTNPYTLIQDAIDAAINGDTINVLAGTYNENITIDRELTLQGENNETTIIQSVLEGGMYGSYGDRVAIIESNNVTISGFTMSGYTSTPDKEGSTSWCIYAYPSSSYNGIGILNNIFTFYTQGGIRLGNVDGATISGNTFQRETRSIWYDPPGVEPGSYVDTTRNGSGPELWNCNNIEVDSNIIETNGVGMFLYGSNDITIKNNTVSASDTTNPSDVGIHIQSSDNINVQENTISNFTAGEKEGYNNGTNGAGINIHYSTNCLIEKNKLNDNTLGVLIRGAENNSNIVINNNNVENNDEFGVLNCSTWVGKDRTYTEATASIDATLNWWNDESGPSGIGPGTGDAVSTNVDYDPWLGATYGTTPMTLYTNDSIQDAIIAATNGDTINVLAGTYNEGIITINKDLAIIGVATLDKPIINPVVDTGTANAIGSTGRGWFQIHGGATVNFENLVFDGTGKLIYTAVHYHGDSNGGTVKNCNFMNIQHSQYQGRGINNYGQYVEVFNCTLDNIQRIGVFTYNPTAKTLIKSCTYSGKGVGDWLDYAFEVGNGGEITVEYCTITNCRGIDSGWTSAGILATSYYGLAPTATITGSDIYNNSDGVWIGYNDTDTSIAILTNNNIYDNDYNGIVVQAGTNTATGHYNNIYGNGEYGVKVISGSTLHDFEYNWWNDESGPSGIGPGTGDAVSTNVDYDPWLLSQYYTSYSISADVTSNKTSINTGGTINFDASSSTVIFSSDNKYYYWDWDGNGTYDEQTISSTLSHKFNSAGTFNINLKVTDFSGDISTDTVTVTITSPPSPSPPPPEPEPEEEPEPEPEEELTEEEKHQQAEEEVEEEVSTEENTQITVADEKVVIDISLDAIIGEEGEALEVTVIAENFTDREKIEKEHANVEITVRAEGEHAAIRELPEGQTVTYYGEYNIGSDIYEFDIEGEIGTDDSPFSKDVELTLEYDEDIINPTLAYWDEESEQWVTFDSIIIDPNHLSASFNSLEDLTLCILDDVSTQVVEVIDASAGGTVENVLEDVTITLDIPAGAVDEDIEVAITQVTVTEHIDKMTSKEGKFKIDGKIYDFRAITTEDGTKVGTVDNPFSEPVTITLECSPGTENPTIAWFNPETGTWEEVETVRIDDTHVVASVYHFSKWAVLEVLEAEEVIVEEVEKLAEEIEEEVIEPAKEKVEEKTPERNAFVQFFVNIWRWIINLFE